MTADASGNYSFTVPHNWSGWVTPSKMSHIHSPSSRSYTNLVVDQSGQDYVATFVTTFSVYLPVIIR